MHAQGHTDMHSRKHTHESTRMHTNTQALTSALTHARAKHTSARAHEHASVDKLARLPSLAFLSPFHARTHKRALARARVYIHTHSVAHAHTQHAQTH